MGGLLATAIYGAFVCEGTYDMYRYSQVDVIVVKHFKD